MRTAPPRYCYCRELLERMAAQRKAERAARTARALGDVPQRDGAGRAAVAPGSAAVAGAVEAGGVEAAVAERAAGVAGVVGAAAGQVGLLTAPGTAVTAAQERTAAPTTTRRAPDAAGTADANNGVQGLELVAGLGLGKEQAGSRKRPGVETCLQQSAGAQLGTSHSSSLPLLLDTVAEGVIGASTGSSQLAEQDRWQLQAEMFGTEEDGTNDDSWGEGEEDGGQGTDAEDDDCE